jgi:hypothetical protein
MPEEPPVDLLDDAAIERIAGQVRAEEDSILVPFELLDEHDRPPGTEDASGSMYAKIQQMGVPERVKLALRGNKDARQILARDGNKLIRRFVLENPRITEGEIVAICHNRTADEDILRVVAERREWARNYQVKLALATNPKTPLVLALRQLPALVDRDLAALAKSRNVPQAIALAARRLVIERRERAG